MSNTTLSTHVAFVGMSHVGLVTSSVWADIAGQCGAFDTDEKTLNLLKDGIMPHTEPGLRDLYNKGRLKIEYSSDFSKISKYKTIFICQDTALKGHGRLKKLDILINKALSNISPNSQIILMSQVPVGYCRKLVDRIQKKSSNILLYHWIDTIIMTQAIECFKSPSRIIIGKDFTSNKISKKMKSILDMFHCPVIEMSYESAEITKAAINLYLATSVTFANTLSDLCEVAGANINDVIPALKLDRRIGPYAYLMPGLKIAGGHLERDLEMLRNLARKKSISGGILNSVIKMNKKRYLWAIKKVELVTKNKNNPKIAIWGLSYKKDSDSTLNAPSIEIIKKLQTTCNLVAYDPMAVLPKNIKIKQVEDKYQALKDADCLLILTEWDEFMGVDPNNISSFMKSNNIIDCVNILKSKKEQLSKFNYIAMGS